MEYTYTQSNFSKGVLDPLLFGAVGTEAYQAGLKRCLNFIPDARGYVFRRPGTRYGGLSIKGNSCRIRTLRSPDGPLVVLFVHKQVYIFTIGLRSPVLLDTPYDESDLEELNIAEFQSSFYIVHKDYPPCILHPLSITGFNAFLEESGKASYDAQGEADKMLSEEDAYLTGNWAFDIIKFKRDDYGDIPFSRRRLYPSCQAFKGGRWYLSGSIGEPSTIYASRTPDVSGAYRFNDFTMSESYLVTTEQSLTKTTEYEKGTDNITNVSYDGDSKSVSVKYDPTEPVPEDEIEEGTPVWYKEDGTATTLKDERVKAVETTSTKTYKVNKSVQDDHAIERTEADAYGSRIMWLYTQQRILAGTKRAIWMDSGAVATPRTFDLYSTLATASSDIQPVAYGSFVFYVSADKRSVRAISFNSVAGGYSMVEISQNARSLFTSNIRDIAVMEGKLDILWVLLEDGRLLSCTLTGQSFGWAEHRLGGVAEIRTMTVYHAESEADTLYLVVDRGHCTENDEPIMYLETLDIEDLGFTDHFNLLDGMVMADDLQGELSTDLAEVNKHEFLDGDKIQMSSDTWATEIFEFSPEDIVSDVPNAKSVFVGFPFASEIELLRQELPSNSNSSIGKRRKAVSSILHVYRTGGGKFGFSNGRLESFQRLMKSGAKEELPPALFTGKVNIPASSKVDETFSAVIEADGPLPLTVLSVSTKYSIMEV